MTDPETGEKFTIYIIVVESTTSENVEEEGGGNPDDPPDVDASSEGGSTGNFLLGKLYWHFQFGGGSDYHIDALTLDFSSTSQKQLDLSGIIVGESRGVNLFNSGINSNSLAFGELTLTYSGNNQFLIESNKFDFDYQPNSSFSRNFGTFMGGAIFGRFYNTPVPLPHPFFIQPNFFFGGPFNVIFNGTVTISE